MTDGQVRAIKKDQKVRDKQGRLWIAKHDAFVPATGTVNAQVSLERWDGPTRWVHILRHDSVEF